MNKRIYAIIGLIVAAVMVFTACTAGRGEEAVNETAEIKETVSAVSEENTFELTAEGTTEEITERNTGELDSKPTYKTLNSISRTTTKKAPTTTKRCDDVITKKAVTAKKNVTTTKKAVTTTKKKVTTTKKVVTTTKKPVTTTKKVVTTTKKQTTTKKVTTTAFKWNCKVDGHTSKTGQIGWVDSKAKAVDKALEYLSKHDDYSNFRVEQCHMCGKYTAYIS